MHKLTVIPALVLIVFSVGHSFVGKAFGAEIKILINQAGYDAQGPKEIWLQTDFPPGQIKTFKILQENNIVYQESWGPIIKIKPWKRWYRSGDFSHLCQPGKYRVRIEWQGEDGGSPPFLVDFHRITKLTAPLATQFFFIQRCGLEIPGWHGPCHLDDALILRGGNLI